MKRNWEGQWIKPLVYHNGGKYHFNFTKAIEVVVTGVFVAFLIFLGNRFFIFEKNTELTDEMRKDLVIVKALSYKVNSSVGELTDILFGHIETETRRDKDRVNQQIELYKLNREQRQKDLEKLRRDIEMGKK